MVDEHRKGIQIGAWTNIVIGVLILATPFITTEMALGPLLNGIIVGVLVIALAGYNAYAANQHHTERVFRPAMVNIILGLWALLSGFIFTTGAAYTTLLALFGIALIVVAAYNTWAGNDARRHAVPAPA